MPYALGAEPRIPQVHELLPASKLLVNAMKSANGLEISKIHTKGSLAARRLHVDASEKFLSYSPTKKGAQQSQVYLEDVWEIRTDSTAGRLREVKGAFGVAILTVVDLDMGFTVKTPEEANDLSRALGYLALRARANSDPELRWRRLWTLADTDRSGSLSLSEIKTLLSRINIIYGVHHEKMIQANISPGKKELSFEGFKKVIEQMFTIEALRPIYDAGKSGVVMTFQEMNKILNANVMVTGEVDFTKFCQVLLDYTKNDWYNPEHTNKVYQDMTYPLYDYFINSSHNTYLTGDQLQSDSDIEMYCRALNAGCRCVELDCWDGPNGTPIIYHGFTRTSKIPFKGVIEGIHLSAFVTTPYPVILSLENHTSPQQGAVMAENMKEVFGDSLFVIDGSNPPEKWSPEALKGKIMVKWKALPAVGGHSLDDTNDESASSPKMEESAVVDKMAESANPEAEEEEMHGGKKRKDTNDDLGEGSCPALSALVTVAAHKTKDWGASAKSNFVQSFTETKVEAFAKKNRNDFCAMNCRMLSRIYPKGSRVNSSNYDPTLAWSMGAQVVALNYQTWDDAMHVNEGFFRQNDRAGYVLKPQHLRSGAPAPAGKCTMTIKVICGLQLPKPANKPAGEEIDPLVELCISGAQADKKSVKTKHITDNGLKPVWNETFTFEITEKHIAQLSCKVEDREMLINDAIAEGAIPLTSLRSGYVAVPLRLCSTGQRLEHSAILLHVSFENDETQKPASAETGDSDL